MFSGFRSPFGYLSVERTIGNIWGIMQTAVMSIIMHHFLLHLSPYL